MMLPATVWLHDKTNSSAKWCGGNLDISSSSGGGEQCGNTNIMEQIHHWHCTAIPATYSPLCTLHCSGGNQDLGDRQEFVYIGYL